MKNLLNKVKGGIKMIKDKTVKTIVGVGTMLKDKENRLIIGMVFIGLGGSLVLSIYVKIPQ